MLGRGTYGKVMLVEKKDSGRKYAMKSLRKKFLIDSKTIENTMNERKILEKVKHPFLVGLDFVIKNLNHFILLGILDSG